MTTAIIGQPLSRIEGRLKVTGTATYAAEFDVPNLVHAVLVLSTIAKGRITDIDPRDAEQAPGVLAVLTHRTAPKLPYREHRGAVDPAVGERLHVLQDDRVRFNGQPVAVVVAETRERAEHAASLIRLTYAEEPAVLDVHAALGRAVPPEVGLRDGSPYPADYRRGDPERALAEADVSLDQTYRLPRENHNPMEPHATIARWDGDQLTLWDKSQWVTNTRDEMAAVFGLPPEHVHVVSPFIGGAFGTVLRTWPHVTLAALAARHVGRPVKLVLTRRHMYTGTGYRPDTWQRVALGASREGRLIATIHEATAETSQYEQYTEAVLSATRLLHACPNLRTRYRLVPLDVHTPTYMRGPGEASGMFALECALDELAYALGIDPVELRLRNEPERDEERNLPFSSRSTRECYRVGAERFGWSRRNPKPRSMRDGRWLIGWGMAAATYRMLRNPASARVRLAADGSAVVESAASDMGPGTYTSMTQVACDALGLPPERVRLALGDSTFPRTPSHGGSQTMASVGPAVHAACLAVRAKVLQLAAADGHSPLRGARAEHIGAADGRLFLMADPFRGDTYREILARHRRDHMEAHETSASGDEGQRFSMHAFGAVFAEVAVDPDLGHTRARRIVGAFGAGRIVNPKMAHSQAIGGMVGGVGMALMEHTVSDRRNGRIVNANLVDYPVPVNADISELDAAFVEEDDRHVNPLGVKGLAELALIGVAPAIANAVFHATGKRIRELPITPDKLL
jgi:xanthine dehydrogenase YagR molybdenum-binding subunit